MSMAVSEAELMTSSVRRAGTDDPLCSGEPNTVLLPTDRGNEWHQVDIGPLRTRRTSRSRRAEGRRMGRPYADEAAAKYTWAGHMRLEGVPVLAISRTTGFQSQYPHRVPPTPWHPGPGPGRASVRPCTAADGKAD